MGTLIRTAAAVVALLFLILTAWSVTVTGFFEAARCDAPHFDAGFGWNKRILWVQDNALTYMYSLDEP